MRLLIPRIGLSLVQGCLLREGEVRLLVPRIGLSLCAGLPIAGG